MWIATGKNIKMTEGDFGIQLPITVGGVTLTSLDSFRITFKTAVNGVEILTKEFTNITNNTINLEFTEAESALFAAGSVCVYSLDWYQSGLFMCNIIPTGTLKVVDKA